MSCPQGLFGILHPNRMEACDLGPASGQACEEGRKKMCASLSGSYQKYKTSFDNTLTQMNRVRTTMGEQSQSLSKDGCGTFTMPSTYTPKF